MMIDEDKVYTAGVLNRQALTLMDECNPRATLMVCVVDRWGNEEYMPVHAIGQMVDEGTCRTDAIVLYHIEGREPIEPTASKGGDDD